MQQRDWEGVCREVPQIFFLWPFLLLHILCYPAGGCAVEPWIIHKFPS